MTDNNLTILNEKFKKENSTQEVEGLTVLVDGLIQQVFDNIKNIREYESYNEVLRDVIFEGINSIISKENNKQNYSFTQSRTLPDLYLLTEIQNDNGFSSHLAYDAKDYLTSITDSSQATFLLKRNELGLISTVTQNQKTEDWSNVNTGQNLRH